MENENKKEIRKARFKGMLGGLFLAIAGLLVVVGWGMMFEVKIQPSQKFLAAIRNEEAKAEENKEVTAEELAAVVIPKDGYEVKLKWGEVGKKLVAAGGVEMKKFGENYKEGGYEDELRYLTENIDGGIRVDAKNAYFWVNTLWALGLTQKSDVLDKGVMGTEYRKDLGNFASTAGWTLGAKDAVKLYSSTNIIDLDAAENARVTEISSNIYRPCCGNSAAFPDCNHGMAILGLVELMVDQGFSDEEIYKASLAFNSYWFQQTYIDLAYYFQSRENLSWDKVEPKKVLGAQYSSSSGYLGIKEIIAEDAPTLQSGGSSCGA